MAGDFNPGLIPGANFGGSNQGTNAPGAFSANTPAVGGTNNPLLPNFAPGQSMPSPSDPQNAAPSGGLAGTNPSTLWGLGQGDPNSAHDFVKAMRKAGFSAGVAGQLWNFINSGAGFNPQVAQALEAAMQPGIQRGEADIMEQFSGAGLRGSTSAQVGLGDYLSQVQLNEGQIWAGLYEQSVQNFMNVLMAGKGPAPKSTFDNILNWVSTMSKATMGAASAGEV